MVDYIYIIVFLVLLIWYLCPNEEVVKINQYVLIELDNNVIKTDLTNAITHITSLKNNLITLNKFDYNLDDEANTQKLDKLINACADDMDKFKQANNFSDIDLEFSTDHLSQQIIGKKFDNLKSSQSDVTDVQFKKFEFANLIIDLEIVSHLLKSGNNNGRITLSNVYALIELLPKTLKFDKKYLSYYDVYKTDDDVSNLNNDKLDDIDTHFLALAGNYTGKISSINRHSDRSQNIDKSFGNLQEDGEVFANDNITLANIKPSIIPNITLSYQNAMNTQVFGSSGVNDTSVKKCIKNYVPFCDINKIRKNKGKVRRRLMDLSSKQSLRDDYNLNA